MLMSILRKRSHGRITKISESQSSDDKNFLSVEASVSLWPIDINFRYLRQDEHSFLDEMGLAVGVIGFSVDVTDISTSVAVPSLSFNTKTQNLPRSLFLCSWSRAGRSYRQRHQLKESVGMILTVILRCFRFVLSISSRIENHVSYS